jgi:hypothetical protein
MRRFLNLYQYLAPALLLPVSYWLWFERSRNHRFVVLVLTVPILFAYIIPGLGTNWLKLWEIRTRWRLGKFRPHHGFVFGTAASLFALLCVEPRPSGFGLGEALRAGFVMGSVLAFWNWLYDIAAIRAGFIVVYNQPYSQKLGPEAIATDYAPVLFGVFGLCYGTTIRAGQHYLLELGRWDLTVWLTVWGTLAVLVLPVLAFVVSSLLKNKTTGLKPLKGD